jgi:methionine-rich copper-binding protein CopC
MKSMTTFGVTIVLALQLGATGAAAQCAFDQSEPDYNAVLDRAPTQMTIRFLLGIELQNVRLVGEDGKVWATNWTPSKEDVFSVEFRAQEMLPPGKYQIEWTAYIRHHYHGDGGVIPFTITAPEARDSNAVVTPAAAPPATAAPRTATGWPYRALRAGSAPQTDR